jgi:hypothetical protein
MPPPLRRALTVLTESALTSLSSTANALPPPVPQPPATIEVPAQISAPAESPAEKRLRNLQELRDKNLISQTEYDGKRQQVLTEI